MGRGRKISFFIHLETQYAKTDYKNEIYAKNWVRRTWTAKVNSEKSQQLDHSQWSMVKVNVVNGQQMMLAR